MAGSLIETKFFVPGLRRGHVARPTMLRALEAAGEARLTLVSAPAGFGKTTLLMEWMTTHAGGGRTIAWLSLDEHDREPATFLTYLVAAIHRALPDVGPTAIELLTSSAAAAEPVITALLNDLASTGSEVWLVLDDYHLAGGPEVDGAMTFLIDHLPAHAHVVIGTRADPGFPLSRLRARGQLIEVRAADLRFSPSDAGAYLIGSGIDLAPDEVAILADRTEGWIAALQLAAISLRGRADASDFIRRFAGDDRYVVDYLIEEVLSTQPERVRDFLLRTATLSRFSASLSDAALDRNDSKEVIAGLERANLFVVPLDDRRAWYRYHHLFADVLRARLLDEQPDEVLAVHDRASRWYEEQGAVRDAVEHALAGRAFDRAVGLMEQAAPRIRRDRDDAIFLAWLDRLPERSVRSSPVLVVFRGYSFMLTGDFDAAERCFADAERAIAATAPGEAPPRDESDELRTLPATIAVYRASIAQAQGDAERTLRHAQEALRLAGPNDHQSRSGGAGFLGMAAWAQGDVTTAIRSFSLAVASLHAGGNLIDELGGTVILADLWIAAGRPGRARRLYDDALQEAERHGAAASRAAADLHVGVSELDIRASDRPAAVRHLAQAADAGSPRGMPESHYRWFLAQAMLARAEGDSDQAIRFLDKAEQRYHAGFFPDVRPIDAMRARVLIARGDLRDAAEWARDRHLSPDDEAEYRHEFEHLTLARLLLATGAAAEAIGLLERLQDAAEAAERGGSLFETRMLLSLALEADGRTAEAVALLAQALEAAPEASAYPQAFLDEGAAMTHLLRRVAGAAGSGSQAASEVLRATPGAITTPPEPRRSALLSDRELQVLRLLDSELSGPDIARQLFVSQNTLRSHTKHIFTKLEVTSRRSAVLRARERGLL